MIVSTLELVTGILVWVGNAANGVFKAHVATQQALVSDQKAYCPPVNSLPNDTPQWKIDIYQQQCSGVASYLNKPAQVQLKKVSEPKKDDDP